MTIGVDAGMLGVTDERLKLGVYRVAYNLLKHISRLDTKNSYRLYSFHPVDGFGPNIQNIVLGARGFLRARLPLELRRNPVDLFLGLGQALPPFLSAPSIGYVHDIGFRFHPDAYGNSYKKLEKNTADLVRRATHIVAVSETTKRDIVRVYGRNPSTITVCYNGVDERFTLKGKKYKHQKPYFLFVGSLNCAKDIPLLLRSFAKTRGCDLILVGGEYWPDPAIDTAMLRYGLNERVIKVGHVSDEKLAMYYRGAIAFVTAALHEGFCLPAVEAMVCGTPVIAVNRGALPEIVGDAGLIVEPGHLSEAMNKIRRNRSRLAKLSLIQAKLFSWSASAQKLLALIHAR